MDENNLSVVTRHGNVLESLGDREPTTVLEAQAVIENIRAEKGYLDPETAQHLNALPPRSRQNISRIIARKRETEAAYTKSISEQLYSSRYRFLYELVQNADDACYARTHNTIPSMNITVTPSAIIVQTNEDGFTRDNVEAICATGKSSKKASAEDSHIGEKGFGFKSVFSIADKVHIQSGVWSFRFEHQQGEDGLGMVTPLENPTDAAAQTGTRITLSLSETTRQEYERLLDALDDLPDTIIFYLQKLRKIEINMVRPDGSSEAREIHKRVDLFDHKVTLTRTTRRDDQGPEHDNIDESVYHVFSHTISQMPQDVRRRGRTSAKVELAFPVRTDDGQPKLCDRGQYVFAYLPLQRLSQIQFLIQSDFITSASRENVIDCAWNDKIRDGVAKVFTTAIAAFATRDHPLRYSWLDYLPIRPMEHPWRPLYASIKNMLQNMPVLQTWEARRFQRPGSLRRLIPSTLHEGEPLFRDLADEIYLAPEYGEGNSDALNDLGVGIISWADLLNRLRADLSRTDSLYKTRPASDSWHTSCASLLVRLFQSQELNAMQQQVKRLAVIPLREGASWTGAPGVNAGGINRIYFPTTDGIYIPGDIGLHLVEKVAASMNQRRALFEAMGVEECPQEVVFAAIEATHTRANTRITLLPHFRYLFKFHPQPESVRAWIKVPTEAVFYQPTSAPLYFPSDGEYDTQNLLPEHFRTSLNNTALFIQASLVNADRPTVPAQNLTWIEWLERATGARYHPPLVQAKGNSAFELSHVMNAVLEHRPEKFVGTLREHWTEYRPDAHHIMPQLRECEVPCETGTTVPIQATYLPTTEIRSELRRLNAEHGFPLLKLPCPLDNSNHNEWRFLEELGVHSSTDMEFYKLVLENMIERVGMTMERVIVVYKCMAQLASAQHEEDLRTFFNSRCSIAFVDDHNALQWTTPEECVWEGPQFLTIKVPLQRRYGEEPRLGTFFSMFLGIRDFTNEDILRELERRRDTNNGHPWSNSDAEIVYQFLDTTAQVDSERQIIREAFRTRRLVMGNSQDWHTLHSCLWGTPFSLANFVDLSIIYPNLESFFVARLGVTNANPAMLVNEIRRMARGSEPRIDEIRLRLVDVGKMVAKSGIDESVRRALVALKEISFLPKKTADETLVLVGVNDDFGILDHKRYGEAFAEHSVLLDFTLEQTQILDKVFGFLGLKEHYLSNIVREESTVGEDAVVSDILSQQLQDKAYPLYCCAAKYKSVKALRDETELFDQLSNARVYTTNDISTSLVLMLGSSTIRLRSDRPVLHDEFFENQLKLYVPHNTSQQAACYRSQLPNFMARFLGVTGGATHPISLILSSNLSVLEDILFEQDIPPVEWIEQPRIERPTPSEDDRSTTAAPTPRSPASHYDGSVTLPMPPTPTRAPFTPETNADRDGRYSPPSPADDTRVPGRGAPHQYERFIEQVVQSAQRARYRQVRPYTNVAPAQDSPPADDTLLYNFNHIATFGTRDVDTMGHDRRIGAAGEAYVFEFLSHLNLPGFSRENWRSTIRGELHGHSRYSDLENWVGRETADLVYTDRDGSLTQYLQENCFGDFPVGIQDDRDFATEPIEYFLEVKSTTGGCHTRFFMSGSQFQLMQNLALPSSGTISRVYVIFRVFNLSSRDVDMEIFVDPIRFRGSHLDFEVQTWVGKVRDASNMSR